VDNNVHKIKFVLNNLHFTHLCQ